MVTRDRGRPRAPARRAGWRRLARALVWPCLVLAVAVPTAAAAPPAGAPPPLWATEGGRARVFQAVVDVFRDRYWAPAARDWGAWAESYRQEVVGAADRGSFDAALRRMVHAVGDDHSRWLGLSRYPGSEGVPGPDPTLGVLTSYLRSSGLVVTRVLPGSPAEGAGLRRGDVIERVDDADLRGRSGWDAGGLLTRAVSAGEVVRLGMRRGRARFDARLTPALLEQQSLAAEPSARMLDDDTGYLQLPSFTREDTGARVHALLRDLQERGARRLVLDMRGNLGGRLTQLGLAMGAFHDGAFARAVSRGSVAWVGSYAVEQGAGVARLTAPDGRLVGEARVLSPTRFAGPVVVLVDDRNSSAGEVAPLELQGRGRARVVGVPTDGNVEAVQGFDLPDGSVVLVAVANLETPDGGSFDGGVQPDRIAGDTLAGLARGFDASVAAARALLDGLPFVPGALF